MEDNQNTNPEEQLSTEVLQEVSGGVNTLEEATQNITHLEHPSAIAKSNDQLQDIRLSEVDEVIKGS